MKATEFIIRYEDNSTKTFKRGLIFGLPDERMRDLNNTDVLMNQMKIKPIELLAIDQHLRNHINEEMKSGDMMAKIFLDLLVREPKAE